MVHALEESWRVLVPRGQLIDLRPRSTDSPFEVIFPKEVKVAGLVDWSLDLEADIAADQALEAIIQAGAFKVKERTFFDFSYYWDSIDAAVAYVREEWEGNAQLPKKVIKRARDLQASSRVQSRVRIPVRLQLTSLEKT